MSTNKNHTFLRGGVIAVGIVMACLYFFVDPFWVASYFVGDSAVEGEINSNGVEYQRSRVHGMMHTLNRLYVLVIGIWACATIWAFQQQDLQQNDYDHITTCTKAQDQEDQQHHHPDQTARTIHSRAQEGQGQAHQQQQHLPCHPTFPNMVFKGDNMHNYNACTFQGNGGVKSRVHAARGDQIHDHLRERRKYCEMNEST
jgi:hypothetical protein